MIKKRFKQSTRLGVTTKHYWFTIQSPNGQTLATSETYTAAAMRDKGIEAVKDVVMAVVFPKPKRLKDVFPKRTHRPIVADPKPNMGRRNIKTSGTGWKVSEVKRNRRFAKQRDLPRGKRKPADVFHLEDKKGKIKKR